MFGLLLSPDSSRDLPSIKYSCRDFLFLSCFLDLAIGDCTQAPTSIPPLFSVLNPSTPLLAFPWTDPGRLHAQLLVRAYDHRRRRVLA